MKSKIIFLLIVLILSSYLLFQKKQPAQTSLKKIPTCSAIYSKSDCDLWSSKIDSLGADKTYAEFKNKYLQSDVGAQHQMAHLFGNLLYQKLGTSGISVCDPTFNYGCYHGFFSAAVGSEGLGVIEKLKEKCDEGCQHGIGHGIVVYLGYDQSKLNDALNVCDKSNLIDTKLGCKGGVFMEYNMRTMLAINKIREFDIKFPYGPCQQVGIKSQSACFYWLSQWWNNSLQNGNEITIRTEGTMCTSLPQGKNKDECFLGIGGAIQQFAGWKAPNNVKMCSIINDPQGQLLCRAGAARMFFADLRYRDQSSNFCDDLLGDSKTQCQNLNQQQFKEAAFIN